MDEPEQSSELIQKIEQFKARAESAAIAAEAANSKANSESGFAFNAKQNAEEHAKAISQVRGTIDAEFSTLGTIKKNAEEASNAVSAAKATVDSNAQLVAAKKDQIEKDAETAKSIREQCSASLPIIEQASKDVAAALKVANDASQLIAATKSNSEEWAATIKSSMEDMGEIVADAKTGGESIASIEANAKAILASISKVADTANMVHERVMGYEKKLAEMSENYLALNQKIEGLLPNATSAGLASAFRNQKERFRKPQRNWLFAFVVSIFLLLAVGLVGAPITGADASWDAIFRHLAMRLPLIVPLIWLGIYAGRNYMLALRVEEEYAFKEAVSTAFEGYKREMANISASTQNDVPPLIVLCENVLRALSQRPGRIYEGRHEDITPLSPVRGMFGLKKGYTPPNLEPNPDKGE